VIARFAYITARDGMNAKGMRGRVIIDEEYLERKQGDSIPSVKSGEASLNNPSA